MSFSLAEYCTLETSENDKENGLWLLATGEQALAARLNLFRHAESSIDLQSFALGDDEIGRLIVGELLEAAKRGVQVRIVIDAWNAGKTPAFSTAIASCHKNLRLKHYNKPTESEKLSVLDAAALQFSNPSVLHHRMHNKSLIIDEQVAIVGGRNYENAYFDRGEKRNFLDRELIAAGSVVKDVRDSFSCFFESGLSELVPSDKDASKERCRQFAETREAEIFSSAYKKSASHEYLSSNILDTPFFPERVECVVDTPPDELSMEAIQSKNRTLESFCSTISKAEKSIFLQSPYFVLDDAQLAAISEARKNDDSMPIVVSTNSLASTDNVVAYAFSFRERGEYIGSHALEVFEIRPFPRDDDRLIEYRRPDAERNEKVPHEGWHVCLHAKTYVVDQNTVWIGSANLDPRSAKINTELGLHIVDAALAEKVQGEIAAHISPQNSWTVGLVEQSPLLEGLTSVMRDTLPESLSTGIEQLLDGKGETERRSTGNYNLRDGCDAVPCFHPEFQDNFEPERSLSDGEFSIRDVQARLIAALQGAGREYI